MAKYIGTDKKKHNANIIGLLPSSDYDTEVSMDNWVDGFDFENLFNKLEKWKDENTFRVIYVQFSLKEDKDGNEVRVVKGMTIQFDDEEDISVELNKKEIDYLTKVIKEFYEKEENK